MKVKTLVAVYGMFLFTHINVTQAQDVNEVFRQWLDLVQSNIAPYDFTFEKSAWLIGETLNAQQVKLQLPSKADGYEESNGQYALSLKSVDKITNPYTRLQYHSKLESTFFLEEVGLLQPYLWPAMRIATNNITKVFPNEVANNAIINAFPYSQPGTHYYAVANLTPGTIVDISGTIRFKPKQDSGIKPKDVIIAQNPLVPIIVTNRDSRIPHGVLQVVEVNVDQKTAHHPAFSNSILSANPLHIRRETRRSAPLPVGRTKIDFIRLK